MPKSNAEKLGIEPGAAVAVRNAPGGGVGSAPEPGPLGELPKGATVTDELAAADVVLLFADDSAQLRRDAPELFAAAGAETKIWIAFRKGKASDLGRDNVMPAFVDLGWHGVSLVSLDATWSAGRFRRIEQIGK